MHRGGDYGSVYLLYFGRIFPPKTGGAGRVENPCLKRSHFTTWSLHSAVRDVCKLIEKQTFLQPRLGTYPQTLFSRKGFNKSIKLRLVLLKTLTVLKKKKKREKLI